jgi:sn-glycerol 3-phosphate transport system substrate-binding protein
MKTRKIMFWMLLAVLIGSVGVYAKPAKVTGPVTIQIWHNRGVGANGDQLGAAVKKFNATNKLGITVKEVFQGGYDSTLSKTMQALAAGFSPQLVVLGQAGVPELVQQNILLDMKPYAKRDHVDTKNFVKALMNFSYYKGQLVSLPYIRSTPVLYYNKGLFAKAGCTKAPKTIKELIEVWKKVSVVKSGLNTVYGFELLNDPSYLIQNMIYQLGGELMSKDGNSSPCLNDGTLLKVLTAWREWVDNGWCLAPSVTNASAALKDAFNQGKIASLFASSGAMTDFIEKGKAAGIDVGVAELPTFRKKAAPAGGGNLAIIKKNSSEQQVAAAWEFMKFLMSDEQAADNAVKTGYLPVTYSSMKTATIKNLWAKNPAYKIASDQMAYAQAMPWSPYKAEYQQVLIEAFSRLIIARDITPKQTVANIKKEASRIFPRKK